MNVRFFRTVGCYALATAGLTLAMLLPGTLNAGNPVAKPQPIAVPTLDAAGVKLSATLSATTQPSVELVAENTTDKPVDTPWLLQMSEPGRFSAGSRVGPMPTILWTKSGTIALQPGEKKTLTFDPQIAAANGSSRNLLLGSGNRLINALPVAVLQPSKDAAGQEVLFADGHVEQDHNPFAGDSRDNSYASDAKTPTTVPVANSSVK